MMNEERDVQRKLMALQHAEKIGNARKACRYFGIGNPASTDCGMPIKNMAMEA